MSARIIIFVQQPKLKCNRNKVRSFPPWSLLIIHTLRRFLTIAGEEKFVHAFKFNTRLPKAVPNSKTLFIPLDPDRHTKHRFTKLSFWKKTNLLPTLTLGIPFTDLSLHTHKYNLMEGKEKPKLAIEDMELIHLNIPQNIKKGSSNH